MGYIIKQIYENAYESGGELYLPTEKIEPFIEACNIDKIAIIAIELFNLYGSKICPYEELTGFDAGSLFDSSTGRQENSEKCNSFILDCYQKSRNSLQGLYFNAVLAYEE